MPTNHRDKVAELLGPTPVAGPGDPTRGLAGQQTGPIDALHHSAPTPSMGMTVIGSAAPATASPPPTVTGPAGPSAGPVVAPVRHQGPPPGFTSAPTPALGTPVAPRPAVPPRSAIAVHRSSPPGPTGVPAPRQQPADLPTPPVLRKPAVRRDEAALFLVYLFPIGQLPQPSSRPSRQLPPPARETDFAAGLRFEPHDHPESHLIKAESPGEGPTCPGRTDVPELVEEHDPLGGDSERNWERRFLVRPACDDQAAEYAWPPGELFPEGGWDVGEPVVLDPGTVVDRFGSSEGRMFGEDGTVLACRSLPPGQFTSGHHRYKIVKALPVWRTRSAPWFGQPGGGVRYRAVYPAADLVAMGYLTELTGMADGH